jgi:YbbR domain-containing protein
MMSGIKSQKMQSERVRRHLLKLLAVLFSFCLWFYVLNSESLEVQVKLPLVLIPPQGMAISEIPPNEILVKVKGSRAFVRNLFNDNEKVFINLKRRGSKTKRGVFVKILPSDIPHPLGVEVTEILPAELDIKIEKRKTMKIPLKPFLVGEVPSQLELLKYELVPNSLTISGPKSLISSLVNLETSPIDLQKLEGDGRIKVLLKELDPRLRAVSDITEAEFLFRVKPKKANFTLKNISIRFLTSSSNFLAKVRTASIDVLIPDGGDFKLSAKDVRLVAEIPDESKGEVRIKLKVELPEGVHLLQIYPETITVGLLDSKE